MALTMYCATADVYRYATEMNIADNPLNSASTPITQYIKDATITVKMVLNGRYDLTVIEDLLTLSKLSTIVSYTAQQTALLLWQFLSVGEQGSPRVESVRSHIKSMHYLIGMGALVDDDNNYVTSINGPVRLTTPIPTELEAVYAIA